MWSVVQSTHKNLDKVKTGTKSNFKEAEMDTFSAWIHAISFPKKGVFTQKVPTEVAFLIVKQQVKYLLSSKSNSIHY